MKPLEEDRTRRYATDKEFADDIQHYLTDQPVEARAPSPLYRLQKFVCRSMTHGGGHSPRKTLFDWPRTPCRL